MRHETRCVSQGTPLDGWHDPEGCDCMAAEVDRLCASLSEAVEVFRYHDCPVGQVGDCYLCELVGEADQLTIGGCQVRSFYGEHDHQYANHRCRWCDEPIPRPLAGPEQIMCHDCGRFNRADSHCGCNESGTLRLDSLAFLAAAGLAVVPVSLVVLFVSRLVGSVAGVIT